jgi:Rrf2 family protein
MTKMNRNVEYALIALKYIAGQTAGSLISVREIADTTRVPFDATSRVMQKLAKKGILKSEQGIHGGYVLVRDLARVGFLDILEAITGSVKVVRCSDGANQCGLKMSCMVHNPLQEFQNKLQDFYRHLSVAEIIGLRSTRTTTTSIGTSTANHAVAGSL